VDTGDKAVLGSQDLNPFAAAAPLANSALKEEKEL
jgi:hypothetical protein